MMSLLYELKLCQNEFTTQYTTEETTKSVNQYHWAFEELRANCEQKAVLINTASIFQTAGCSWPGEGGEGWVRVTQTQQR